MFSTSSTSSTSTLRATAGGVAALLVAGLLSCLGAAPAQAADKDCGDFASQKAAQIFFIKHGGPQQDPHRLDDDGDGIACETNPAPTYYGTTLPGAQPAPVETSADLVARPATAIAGERVRLRASTTPRIHRPVVLQRRKGDRWVEVDRAVTSGKGRHTFGVRAADRSYRVRVPVKKTGAKRFLAATSPTVEVSTLPQQVMLTFDRSSIGEGETAGVVVEASPARRDRPVSLQRRTARGWKTVGVERESKAGRARFDVSPSLGEHAYRAVVRRFEGAVRARSGRATLSVLDVTAPSTPSNLTVEPQPFNQIFVSWTRVLDEDVDHYLLYRGVDGAPLEFLDVLAPEFYAVYLDAPPEGSVFEFAIRSVDEAGNESPLSASVFYPDVVAPAPPQNVHATPGVGYVRVDWSAVSDPDLAGYRVFRQVGSGPWELLASGVATNTFTDHDVVGGQSYGYYVTAVDEAGNESYISAPSYAIPG